MKYALRLSVVTLVALACSDEPTSPRLLAGEGPSLAAVTTTTNTIIPLNILVLVSCANGGAGEVVALSGNLHLVFHSTTSNSGNTTLKTHTQPQGVSGVGLVTGDKYQGTGVTQSITHIQDPLPFTSTFVNNFRVIGQGPGNNFLVHVNTHITVNANGDVTSTVNNTSIECK